MRTVILILAFLLSDIRVPAQQADPAQQALEALADPALHRAGFRRDDAAPRYSVQVSARTTRTLSPYADPWDPWGGWGSWGFGYGSRGGIGIGFGMPFGRTRYDIEEAGVEHERLVAAGVTVVRPPQVEPWGLVELWVEDPDGVSIVLVEVRSNGSISQS